MDKNREIKQLFKKHVNAIRTILYDSFSADYSLEEFDCLVHHVLSVLNNEESKKELKSKIEKEITEHFGLSLNDKDIDVIVSNIWDYWDITT